MKNLLLLALCITVLGCSERKNDEATASAAKRDTTSESSSSAAFREEREKREQSLDEFSSQFAVTQITPSDWITDLTASVQTQYEGKGVSVDGWVMDLIKLDTDQFELTIQPTHLAASVFKIRTDIETGRRIIREEKFGVRLFVALKVLKISPIQLVAKACDEPDCSDIRISEDISGKSYLVRGELLGYRHAQ
jgi:hypothetical protein